MAEPEEKKTPTIAEKYIKEGRDIVSASLPSGILGAFGPLPEPSPPPDPEYYYATGEPITDPKWIKWQQKSEQRSRERRQRQAQEIRRKAVYGPTWVKTQKLIKELHAASNEIKQYDPASAFNIDPEVYDQYPEQVRTQLEEHLRKYRGFSRPEQYSYYNEDGVLVTSDIDDINNVEPGMFDYQEKFARGFEFDEEANIVSNLIRGVKWQDIAYRGPIAIGKGLGTGIWKGAKTVGEMVYDPHVEAEPTMEWGPNKNELISVPGKRRTLWNPIEAFGQGQRNLETNIDQIRWRIANSVAAEPVKAAWHAQPENFPLRRVLNPVGNYLYPSGIEQQEGRFAVAGDIMSFLIGPSRVPGPRVVGRLAGIPLRGARIDPLTPGMNVLYEGIQWSLMTPEELETFAAIVFMAGMGTEQISHFRTTGVATAPMAGRIGFLTQIAYRAGLLKDGAPAYYIAKMKSLNLTVMKHEKKVQSAADDLEKLKSFYDTTEQQFRAKGLKGLALEQPGTLNEIRLAESTLVNKQQLLVEAAEAAEDYAAIIGIPRLQAEKWARTIDVPGHVDGVKRFYDLIRDAPAETRMGRLVQILKDPFFKNIKPHPGMTREIAPWKGAIAEGQIIGSAGRPWSRKGGYLSEFLPDLTAPKPAYEELIKAFKPRTWGENLDSIYESGKSYQTGKSELSIGGQPYSAEESARDEFVRFRREFLAGSPEDQKQYLDNLERELRELERKIIRDTDITSPPFSTVSGKPGPKPEGDYRDDIINFHRLLQKGGLIADNSAFIRDTHEIRGLTIDPTNKHSNAIKASEKWKAKTLEERARGGKDLDAWVEWLLGKDPFASSDDSYYVQTQKVLDNMGYAERGNKLWVYQPVVRSPLKGNYRTATLHAPPGIEVDPILIDKNDIVLFGNRNENELIIDAEALAKGTKGQRRTPDFGDYGTQEVPRITDLDKRMVTASAMVSKLSKQWNTGKKVNPDQLKGWQSELNRLKGERGQLIEDTLATLDEIAPRSGETRVEELGRRDMELIVPTPKWEGIYPPRTSLYGPSYVGWSKGSMEELYRRLQNKSDTWIDPQSEWYDSIDASPMGEYAELRREIFEGRGRIRISQKQMFPSETELYQRDVEGPYYDLVDEAIEHNSNQEPFDPIRNLLNDFEQDSIVGWRGIKPKEEVVGRRSPTEDLLAQGKIPRYISHYDVPRDGYESIASFDRGIIPTAPAGAAPMRPADIGTARTGKPYGGVFFRGSGRETLEEVYDPHYVQSAILGEATYATPIREFAQIYGPKVDEIQITLSNPLVIASDEEWLVITKEAGLYSTVPINPEEIARLRQVIENKGHDGVIIRVPESEGSGKQLQKAFDQDTVVAFRSEAATPTAPAGAAADVPSRISEGDFPEGTLFHGSQQTQTTFRTGIHLSRQSGRMHPGDIGAWFTENVETAQHFADLAKASSGKEGVVNAVRVNLQNPKKYATYQDFLDDVGKTKIGINFQKRLIREGHDGIEIVRSTTDTGITRRDVVAFRNDQIIQATPTAPAGAADPDDLDAVIQQVARAALSGRRGGIPELEGVQFFTDEVIEFGGRNIIMVRLAPPTLDTPGKYQPFYKRTGGGGSRAGAQPGDWAPFDGLTTDNPITGGGVWFNKGNYFWDIDPSDPLFSYGNEKYKQISLALKRIEKDIPKPVQRFNKNDYKLVNEWLGTSNNWLDQGSAIGKGHQLPENISDTMRSMAGGIRSKMLWEKDIDVDIAGDIVDKLKKGEEEQVVVFSADSAIESPGDTNRIRYDVDTRLLDHRKLIYTAQGSRLGSFVHIGDIPPEAIVRGPREIADVLTKDVKDLLKTETMILDDLDKILTTPDPWPRYEMGYQHLGKKVANALRKIKPRTSERGIPYDFEEIRNIALKDIRGDIDHHRNNADDMETASNILSNMAAQIDVEPTLQLKNEALAGFASRIEGYGIDTTTLNLIDRMRTESERLFRIASARITEANEIEELVNVFKWTADEIDAAAGLKFGLDDANKFAGDPVVLDDIERSPIPRDTTEYAVNSLDNYGGPITIRGVHGTFAKKLSPDPKFEGYFRGIHIGTQDAAQDRLMHLNLERTMGPEVKEGIKATPITELNYLQLEIKLNKTIGTIDNPTSENMVWQLRNVPRLMPEAIENGVEGVIYRNVREDPGSISVLIFNKYKKNITEQPTYETVERMSRSGLSPRERLLASGIDVNEQIDIMDKPPLNVENEATRRTQELQNADNLDTRLNDTTIELNALREKKNALDQQRLWGPFDQEQKYIPQPLDGYDIKTGEAFSGALYHGSTRDFVDPDTFTKNDLRQIIFGGKPESPIEGYEQGIYLHSKEKYVADNFGDVSVVYVDLENPLLIETDNEWRALIDYVRERHPGTWIDDTPASPEDILALNEVVTKGFSSRRLGNFPQVLRKNVTDEEHLDGLIDGIIIRMHKWRPDPANPSVTQIDTDKSELLGNIFKEDTVWTPHRFIDEREEFTLASTPTSDFEVFRKKVFVQSADTAVITDLIDESEEFAGEIRRLEFLKNDLLDDYEAIVNRDPSLNYLNSLVNRQTHGKDIYGNQFAAREFESYKVVLNKAEQIDEATEAGRARANVKHKLDIINGTDSVDMKAIQPEALNEALEGPKPPKLKKRRLDEKGKLAQLNEKMLAIFRKDPVTGKPISIGSMQSQLTEYMFDQRALVNDFTRAYKKSILKQAGREFKDKEDASLLFQLGDGSYDAGVSKVKLKVRAIEEFLVKNGMDNNGHFIDFSTFVTLNRAKEIKIVTGRPGPLARGIETIEDAKALIGQIDGIHWENPQAMQVLSDAMDMLLQANNDILIYGVKNGIITREFADQLIEKFPSYTPTVLLDTMENSLMSGTGMNDLMAGEFVRRLGNYGHASAQEFPLRALEGAAGRMERMIQQNNAKTAMIDAVSAMDSEKMIRLPENPAVPHKPHKYDEWGERLYLVDTEEIAALKQEGKQLIAIRENGKWVWYETTDDIALSMTINLQLPAKIRQGIQTLQAPFRFSYTGGNPLFWKVQYLHDVVMSAVLFGSSPIRSGIGLIKNIKAIFKYDPGWEEFVQQGNLMSQGYTRGFSKKAKDIPTIGWERKGNDIVLDNPAKVRKFFGNAMGSIENFGTAFEYAARRGVYEELVKKGWTQRRAAQAARNAFGDWAMRGSWFNFLNPAWLYSNIAVQSALILPRNMNTPGGFLRLTGLLGIVGAMYANNSSYESYKNMSARDKYGRIFWIYGEHRDENNRAIADSLVFVPYVRELQWVVGPLLFAMGKYFGNDPGSFREMMVSSANSGSPLQPLLDTSFTIPVPTVPTESGNMIVELIRNLNPFNEQEIVPELIRNLPPHEQKTAQTSEIAKNVSKAIGGILVPLQIDHIIRRGSFLTSLINGADKWIRLSDEDQELRRMAQHLNDVRDNAPPSMEREAMAGYLNDPSNVPANKRRDVRAEAKQLDREESITGIGFIDAAIKAHWRRGTGYGLYSTGLSEAIQQANKKLDSDYKINKKDTRQLNNVMGRLGAKLDQSREALASDLKNHDIKGKDYDYHIRIESGVYRSSLIPLSIQFPQAAQVRLRGADYQEFLRNIRTVGGYIEDPITKGQFLLAARNSIVPSLNPDGPYLSPNNDAMAEFYDQLDAFDKQHAGDMHLIRTEQRLHGDPVYNQYRSDFAHMKRYFRRGRRFIYRDLSLERTQKAIRNNEEQIDMYETGKMKSQAQVDRLNSLPIMKAYRRYLNQEGLEMRRKSDWLDANLRYWGRTDAFVKGAGSHAEMLWRTKMMP